MARLSRRDWRVRVDTLELTGVDVSFDVTKTLKADPNTCSLRIYNLTEAHRKQIESLSLKPLASAATTPDKRQGKIRVEIEAGYKDAGRPLIFRGDLRRAVTAREDADLVTTLEGEDGGRSVLRARVAQSFPSGTKWDAPVRACAKALGVGTGNLDDLAATLSATFSQGTVVSGSAYTELGLLLRAQGLSFSIQNGVLQLVRRGGALQSTAVRLAPETGLIIPGPSVNPDGTVTATALMIPDLYPGRRVQFDTQALRGFYTIQKARYQGDTFGDTWYVSLEAKA